MPAKSIRLSKQIREDITLAMLEAWVKHTPPPCALQAERKILGDKLHELSFPKLDTGNAPKDMLMCSDEIAVAIDGLVTKYPMSKKRPVRGFNFYNQTPNKNFKTKPPVIKAFEEKELKYNSWVSDKNKFQEEIEQILGAVNTTKQLDEIWPEASNYLPPYASDPSRGIQLPALKTSRLNESLGLKSG